jgi:hypothetical protein
MPSRSAAAATAILPPVAVTLPQVGEQIPGNLVFKTDVTQFRSCAEGTCGQFLDLRFTSAGNVDCL